MRPIVSSINSPTYLLSKWLQKQLDSLPKYTSLSIKNRYELIQNIKDLKIEDNELLVSFDVVSLYPNVPIDVTIEIIKDWLTSINLTTNEVNEYTRLIKLCMNQTTFQFNDLFYTQLNGTAMGNPLSCFIANIFMGHFETLAKESLPYFPK